MPHPSGRPTRPHHPTRTNPGHPPRPAEHGGHPPHSHPGRAPANPGHPAPTPRAARHAAPEGGGYGRGPSRTAPARTPANGTPGPGGRTGRAPARGRLRPGRVLLVAVLGLAAAAGLTYAVSDGRVAASLAQAGQPVKISAARLEGDRVVQYGDGTTPGTVATIGEARLYDLCQSLRVPGLPLVLSARSGRGEPVTARDLTIDLAALAGRATLDGVAVGRDAGDLGSVAPGSLGQSADRVVITDLRQVARASSAGSFRLNGLDVRLGLGAERECF
ncbi:hypothetical protein GCM10010123_43990 [Pilimelia anulata]|uniref:Cholesterol esterase n=1 Tax=Pilimelia anulata TaxID=53371 RepID=A0A8J3BBU2_9ACTN|nr:DUF6230 family protein [Pilimelia anulata]GGK09316.1 hypothetical protein GCM10010123_43990 [Pilimelia anulata]